MPRPNQYISDHDGVRLITNDVCDFLQKVPEVTDEVFRFGTQSPASILLDAVQQLDNQSPKADDNIQLIKPNLVEAVDACVRTPNGSFILLLSNAFYRLKLLGMNLAFTGKSSFYGLHRLANRSSIFTTLMNSSKCARSSVSLTLYDSTRWGFHYPMNNFSASHPKNLLSVLSIAESIS